MADELKETSEGSAPVTDETNPSNNTAVSSLTPTSTVSRGNKKARDGSHGLKFESKLLPLFCIRGLGAGYKFQLGRENEDLAGKFDDVIFRYEVADETDGKHWRYLYLQAKHKENKDERKITANDLLDPKGNGQFSLKKYFLSYCKMRLRGDDVRDCIMCTNWGVNEKKFHKIKLEKVTEPHDILTFASEEISVNIYKLQIDKVLHVETLKLLEKSDNEAMGVTDSFNSETLEDEVYEVVVPHTQDSDNKKKDLENKGKKPKEKKIFKPNFLNDKNLSVDAQNFRQKICELIDDFIKKFILVVDMPNETQFKKIIETEDVSKYYHPDICKVQTIRIIDEIIDAFENKSAGFWLKSEEGKRILLAGVTAVSLEYQGKLKEKVGFNENAIQIMKEKLSQLMDSPGNEKVQRIFTPSPQFTAVKVISAIQILMQELLKTKLKEEIKQESEQESEQEKNYFVLVPYSLLQDEEGMKRWKNILKLQKDFHHFLVVVCDNDAPAIQQYNNFIAEDINNYIINISCDGPLNEMTDEIRFTDLREDFKNKILSRTISFQEKNLTVGELVGNQPEKVIDFTFIKELLLEGKEIKIASINMSNFEESRYIKRRLRIPFDSQFETELADRLDCSLNQLRGEFKITPEGRIEWLVQNKRQLEIWEKMKNVSNKTTQLGIIFKDRQLISFEENKENERPVVIISGVAGTGKSTLLSHFYKEIKREKPDHWIFRINLVDRRHELMKLNADNIDVTNFVVNYLRETGCKDSFTNSLLTHRFGTGDRIVFMFDGFDEIDGKCQRNAIQLMKAITKSKSIQLYVTSRPHSVDDLQKEFFQFSYNLESFDIDDQINYLTEYWETNLQDLEIQDKSIIRNFAASLTDRVSQSLRDKERSFIGVPLQCRILAEWFQLELQTKIKDNKKNGTEQTDFENQLLSNVNFDLNNLYKLLMETKRRVFREEKANSVNQNQIIDFAINRLIKDIESRLTKLAIETLVTDQKSVDILFHPQYFYHQSETKKMEEEKTITEFGIKFGLITFKEGDDEDTVVKTQFLHRTFAEYLLAKYFYEGIAIDHCQDNQLLDNEPVRDLIVSQILVEDNYDGVRVFIDSMLKETINSEKWRLLIKKEAELPFRLKNLANSLAHHITAQREDDASVRSPPSLHPNPITVSLRKSNMNLFFTLFECLERKFDKIEMNSIIRSALDKRCFSFNFFFNFGNSELFRRVIIHYDDADSSEVERIVKEMLYRYDRKQKIETYCISWNKESTKEMVEVVLDFMEKHQSNLNTIWKFSVLNLNRDKEFQRNHFSVQLQLLHFFTFNEYYDSLFPQFFQILSSVHSNDCAFIGLLANTLRGRDANCNNWAYPMNSGIEKTLTNLRDLGRYKVMEELSHLALVSDKKVFDKFYQPRRPNRNDDCSDYQLLLERDSIGMTRLHRSSFYGDQEIVNEILHKIHINFSVFTATAKDLVDFLLRDINPHRLTCVSRFTPFYVAAACGHKEICHKILSFLKENFGADRKKNLKKKGFVYCAMWDAILFENLHMFQLILEVVKETWGQDSLLVLLKTDNSIINYNRNWFYDRNSYTEEYEKKLLKIKVKVLLQNDTKRGYEDLSDLIFASVENTEYSSYSTVKVFEKLKDMEDETLQEMLSVKGFENWMKRFFDWGMDSSKFRFLLDILLDKFTSQQKSQFVDVITSLYSVYSLKFSHWAVWLLFLFPDFPLLEKLLKVIADNDKNSGRSDIHKLLFNDNGKDCTRVVLCQDRQIFSIVLKYLSTTDQIKIMKYVGENGPEIIDEIFHPRFDIERFHPILKEEALRYWVNILSFYDDRTKKPQFEKLVKTLLLLRTDFNPINSRTNLKVRYSFWSKYLDSYNDDKVEMVDKFLKLVSEKLGKRALIQVVLHKDGKGIVLLGAELQENKQLVKVMLSHLSDRDRDCVYLLFIKNSPFNSRR